MKIIIALALFLSLCLGYEDYTWTAQANSTQTDGGSDSAGVCDCSIVYTDSTKEAHFTATCTGMEGNITAIHCHAVDTVSSYYGVTYGVGNPLTDMVLTNTDGSVTTFDIKWTISDASAKAICEDQVYINIHSTAFPNGEVRANMVGMCPMCNIKDYKTDGTPYTFGTAPATGIQSNCISLYNTSEDGAASCLTTYCYLSDTNEAIVSGSCTGFTTEIYSMYAYYPTDTYSFIAIAPGRYFEPSTPFSFRVRSSYYDEWSQAKIVSGKSYVYIDTYLDSNEVYIALTASGDSSLIRPAGKCFPNTIDLPEEILTCESGSYDFYIETECYSTDYVCSLQNSVGEYRGCQYIPNAENCYLCDCTQDIDWDTDFPTLEYACCNTNDCNDDDEDLKDIACDYSAFASSSIALPSLFVSLIVAFFMKWF